MKSNKIFKVTFLVLIVLSAIMIVTNDDATRRVMWLNIMILHGLVLFDEINSEANKKIMDIQKKIIEEQDKQIDILKNMIIKKEEVIIFK